MSGVLISTVNGFFWILYGMLFARILLSWFPMARGNRLAEMLFMLTEPILSPVRRLVQKSPLGGPGMMIDFSPIIVFILLRVARDVVISIISSVF